MKKYERIESVNTDLIQAKHEIEIDLEEMKEKLSKTLINLKSKEE